jgi:hypothetical protein
MKKNKNPPKKYLKKKKRNFAKIQALFLHFRIHTKIQEALEGTQHGQSLLAQREAKDALKKPAYRWKPF